MGAHISPEDKEEGQEGEEEKEEEKEEEEGESHPIEMLTEQHLYTPACAYSLARSLTLAYEQRAAYAHIPTPPSSSTGGASDRKRSIHLELPLSRPPTLPHQFRRSLPLNPPRLRSAQHILRPALKSLRVGSARSNESVNRITCSLRKSCRRCRLGLNHRRHDRIIIILSRGGRRRSRTRMTAEGTRQTRRREEIQVKGCIRWSPKGPELRLKRQIKIKSHGTTRPTPRRGFGSGW